MKLSKICMQICKVYSIHVKYTVDMWYSMWLENENCETENYAPELQSWIEYNYLHYPIQMRSQLSNKNHKIKICFVFIFIYFYFLDDLNSYQALSSSFNNVRINLSDFFLTLALTIEPDNESRTNL